jgi:sec-independent protein translocase protein TatC
MTNLKYYLLEIKLRLCYLIFSIICTFLISYNFQVEFVYIIGKPFIELQQTFIFLELTEAFYTLLRISTIITLLVIIPYIFYHIWSFLIPSFYEIERKKFTDFFLLLLFLFLSEIVFIYYMILPQICDFLISFEITSEIKNPALHLKPLISVELTARIESYVKLLVKIFTLILLLFQIPPCICLFYSKKILQVSTLYSNRKFLSFLSLLLSAFVVPPDIASQFLLAVFFFILFEVLIFIGLLFL